MSQSKTFENIEYSGMAYVYSFPFWLYVDTSSPLPVEEVQLGELEVRIYPPFRCGPANFISMPHIDFQQIPFLPDANPNKLQFKILHAVAYPLLEINREGKTSLFVATTGKWDKQINPFPMDCLRMDILQKEKEGDLNIAKPIVRKLLDLIRWYTKQWWINHSIDGLLGYQRSKFPIAKNGIILKEPLSCGSMRTISGDERPLNTDVWRSVIGDLNSQKEPPSYDLLLLDARYFSSVGDIKRTVLDLAMACEQALALAVNRIRRSQIGNKPIKLPGNDLSKKLGTHLKKYTTRSYQDEAFMEFSIIKNLWSTRNNVAHGKQVKVGEKEVNEFIRSSQHCIRWIESL